MQNIYEAGKKANAIVGELAKGSPDQAWHRVHTQFNASDEADARLVGLVLARWVLCNMAAPKHHHAIMAMASVLAAIRVHYDLAALWVSDTLSETIADISDAIRIARAS